MKISEINKRIKKIKKLKLENNFDNSKLSELIKLPIVNGIIELKFKNKSFFMLNINNDDGVVIKYLWRNKYENLSLSLWYALTRKEGYFADIGAHTGIYSLIANIEKTENNVISIEPFFINFTRMLSNMRLNNISTNNCFLSALSNAEGIDKIKINTKNFYHSSGGKISVDGNLQIEKKMLDNFSFPKALRLIKIDTEGHEYKVLCGAKNVIKQYLPDIIFEINENSFEESIKFLKEFKYNFYFIDEKKNKMHNIIEFNKNLIRDEGSNCFATNLQHQDLSKLFKEIELS